MSCDLNVVRTASGTYAVKTADGTTVASEFTTHADAWRWIDKHSQEGRRDTDRHHRIRQSSSFS